MVSGQLVMANAADRQEFMTYVERVKAIIFSHICHSAANIFSMQMCANLSKLLSYLPQSYYCTIHAQFISQSTKNTIDISPVSDHVYSRIILSKLNSCLWEDSTQSYTDLTKYKKNI